MSEERRGGERRTGLDPREYSALRDRLDEIDADYKRLAARNFSAIISHWTSTKRILGGLAVGLAIVGTISIWVGLRQSSTLNRVQEGRRAAIGVNCAVIGAVAAAGRQVILTPGQPTSAKQERLFERLGFPPSRARHRAAVQAADTYVKLLVKAVDRQVGGAKGAGLLRPDGTLDCQRLEAVSRVDVR